MNDKELKFVQSILDKIKKYSIPTNLKDCLTHSSGQILVTQYNNGKFEKIDTGIEVFLCFKSPNYFLSNYGFIQIPKLGILPFVPYYFQSELLKDINNLKLLAYLKTRQCLTEDNFIMTDRGYMSIKDVKIDDKIETIVNGEVVFVDVSDSFYTGEKEVCRILINSGLTVTCTLDHKIFTKKGWVEAGNLSLNDEIVSIVNKGKFGGFELKNDDLFGLDIISNQRVLTKELMELNERQMSILLNRLYAGDGWISYKKDKRRPNYIQYEIGIGSPCFKLIKQLEYILQTKYGIACWIYEGFDKRSKTKNRFWKLRITQKKSVINFINRIGIKGKTDTKEVMETISKENPYDSHQNTEKIRKIIRSKETCSVYDITTDSSSFIANGLLVHNCGISTLMSLYCLWRCLFGKAENIDVISTKREKAQDFVTKMKITLNALPPFLRVPITTENKTRITFANGSQITSEPASETAGRGDSLSFVVLDEVAFYRTDSLTRKIAASVISTLSRTGGGLILISTPNSTVASGAYYYEQIVQLQISGNTPTEKLIEVNWYEVPDIDGVRPYRGYNHILNDFIKQDYYNNPVSKRKMVEYFKPIEENWKDNEWLNSLHKKLGDAIFRQEVFHDFVIMGNSVFSSEKIKQVNMRFKEPLRKNTYPNGEEVNGLWIWKLPEKKHKYLIGCDISTGTGKDSSSMQVFDVLEYEQVAEFKGFISTVDFPSIIKKVAKLYNNAFTVIECNSIGEAVFNGVYYDQKDPYYNVFKIKINKNGVQRFSGWYTDSKTRPLITNEFIDWINVDDRWERLKVYSSRLAQEMTTWIWTTGGRADHIAGGKDDCIMAMALCLYHRNAAETSGDSFIVGEDGSLIENIEGVRESTEDTYQSILMSGDNNIIKKKYGVDVDDYKWIIGSN